MNWSAGDTGTTRAGFRYRILCVDAIGRDMPVVALLRIGDDEMVHRYRADGTNGEPAAYQLQEPTKRAA